MSKYKVEEGVLVKVEELFQPDNRKIKTFENFLRLLSSEGIKYELPTWPGKYIIEYFFEKRPTIHLKTWLNGDLRSFDFDFDLKLITASFMKYEPKHPSYMNAYTLEKKISEFWLKSGGVLD